MYIPPSVSNLADSGALSVSPVVGDAASVFILLVDVVIVLVDVVTRAAFDG